MAEQNNTKIIQRLENRVRLLEQDLACADRLNRNLFDFLNEYLTEQYIKVYWPERKLCKETKHHGIHKA